MSVININIESNQNLESDDLSVPQNHPPLTFLVPLHVRIFPPRLLGDFNSVRGLLIIYGYGYIYDKTNQRGKYIKFKHELLLQKNFIYYIVEYNYKFVKFTVIGLLH